MAAVYIDQHPSQLQPVQALPVHSQCPLTSVHRAGWQQPKLVLLSIVKQTADGLISNCLGQPFASP